MIYVRRFNNLKTLDKMSSVSALLIYSLWPTRDISNLRLAKPTLRVSFGIRVNQLIIKLRVKKTVLVCWLISILKFDMSIFK